jgi:aspartate 1-decarboxylase
MSNTLLTIDKVTNEALMVLHGNLAFVKNVNRGYDDQFGVSGGKIGDTLRIRKPPKYTVRSGATMQVQNATETYVSLPITSQKGVDMDFTSKEFALDIDAFSQRFLKPSMAVLASTIDYDALSMTLDVYNSVGSPGTTPATYQVWGDANAILDSNLAPRDGDRTAILSPNAMARTVDGLKGLFQAGDAIADQYRSGVMSRAIDLKWAIDQNIRNVTMGTRTGTTLVTGNPATGTNTVNVDGLGGATQTVKEGEVITIAAVYQVNAETKQTLTNLQQFVVTADAAGVSSEVALTVSPYFYGSGSGALQNISALPLDGAAVTFYGTTTATVYPQNLIFHKDAFTFATADLKLPRAAEMASRKVMDGISMRIWEGSDIVNDAFPVRSDVLYGYVATYPELACRVWG